MRWKVGIVLCVVAVIAAWWLHGHHKAAATSSAATKPNQTSTTRERHAPQAPATLSGKVTRKSDGAPLAGATIAIARAELGAEILPSQAPTLVVTSSAAGTWTSPVAPGTYILVATSPGLLPESLPKLVVGAAEQRSGLDFALDAGGTLVKGTVTDVGGGPITGARITVKSEREFSLSGHADFVAMTGDDGTYQMTVKDGDYAIAASHDDYTHASKSIEVKGKPVTADFTLVPGGSIKGKVIARDSGKPVAGAWIDVRGKHNSSWGVGEGVSDDEGTFQLHSLAAGAISLTASGPGFASSSPTVVELGVGEQVDGITIKVDRAFSITGKIVEKGKPDQGIGGILVGGFSIASQQVALAHEPTDKDGRFEIVGVRPAAYTLAAFGEGKVPDIGKSVEVVDKDIKDVVIELETGVTLTGRVDPPQVASIKLGIDGEVGIANMFEMAKVALVHGNSDATGLFKLEHVPAGKLKISARTEDGAAGELPITVADADQANIVVTLEARASISGTVTDTSGAPAAGAHVDAISTEPRHGMSFDGLPGGTVAADGTFKIVGLEPGKYTMSAGWGWDDRFSGMTKDKKDRPPPLELAKGEAKTGVHLTVEARDGVIRGIVEGTDGHPTADAWVTAHPDRGKDFDFEGFDGTDKAPVLTSADGKFTIDHLKRGTYKLVVDGPRGASRGEKAGVKTGDTVTIELTTLGTLTGRATAGGAPVKVYDLTCKGPAGNIDRRITADDGAYLLEHLAPGSYQCSASADQGTANGTVEVGSSAATLDLTMRPWASVIGTVVSVLSGQPVSGITVIVGGMQDGRGFADVLAGKAPRTDAAGRFRLEHVAAGSGSITLMPSTGGFDTLATKQYTAGDGQVVDVGTIKVVPPRNGDAGTFGLVAGPSKDGKLEVTNVAPGGAAANAGITVGDVITQLDGHAVSDIGVEPAAALLSSGRIGVGATIAITLERGVTVTLTAAKW